MEYKEIRLLKQSDRGMLHLIREKDSERIFVRKVLNGRYSIYAVLQECEHPFLPKLYEVAATEESTTVIEEYIEGETIGSRELSDRQFLCVVSDLCSVLEFLHERGIIHRDIKPSNIIMAHDGHIRLIDFDAARMRKEDLEQDTRLLGTRGYAPPEQYGFSQTDERTDIYAMGVTLRQLLGKKAQKSRYRRIIRKCTELDPDKRYRSIRQVKRAFFYAKWNVLYIAGGIILCLLLLFLWTGSIWPQEQSGDAYSENAELIVLPAPENPHWNGETGIGLWGHVKDSGLVDNEEQYHWRIYRKDTADPPASDDAGWIFEGGMRGDNLDNAFYDMQFGSVFTKNGFYYFSVAAAGDKIQYADSAYVVSDAFEYTGESAPELPSPTGLAWKMVEGGDGSGLMYYATWDNLDDYEDLDCFDVYVYDKAGNYIMNNRWAKEDIIEKGQGGIRIRPEFLSESDNAYRFVVNVYSSRPNVYRSALANDPGWNNGPIAEEYFSSWLYR